MNSKISKLKELLITNLNLTDKALYTLKAQLYF
jgi:hypothetical protein